MRRDDGRDASYVSGGGSSPDKRTKNDRHIDRGGGLVTLREAFIRSVSKMERASLLSRTIAFLVLCVIYVAAISSILRANFFYIDDIGRAFEGYDHWSNFSRFLSEGLSHLIHASDYLSDASPLTQLIAVVLLVVASLLIIHEVRDGERVSVWDLIAVVPIGLSPYYLECLSYKYDAPYMALSVLLSVLPLAARRRSTLLYGSLVPICMIGMCTTYQASSGIFPMSVLLICLIDWSRGRKSAIESLKFVGFSAILYLVGVLVFFLFIMVPTGEGEYVSNSVMSNRLS